MVRLQGGVPATTLESTLGIEFLTKLLDVGCDSLPKKLTDRFRTAVVILFSCRVHLAVKKTCQVRLW